MTYQNNKNTEETVSTEKKKKEVSAKPQKISCQVFVSSSNLSNPVKERLKLHYLNEMHTLAGWERILSKI